MLADQDDLSPVSHERENGSPKREGFLIREVTPSPNVVQGHDRRKTNPLAAWSFELLMLLLAFALFAAMVLVLGKYDRREQPNWAGSGQDEQDGTSLTINTLIAVLATVFRAVIAFISFEILAQLKWDWVSACFRPMGDLELFDNASRGVYGALCVLPVLAMQQPLALGAILVAVSSLGIGPLTQQAIHTYPCQQSATQAAAITFSTGLYSDFYSESYWEVTAGVKATIWDAMVNPSAETNNTAFFSCPSGTCRFPHYADNPKQPEKQWVSHASFGMCSRCEDIYELVKGPAISEWNGSTGAYYPRTYYLPRPPVHGNVEEQTSLSITLGPGLSRNYMTVSEPNNYTWAREALPRDFMNLARWSIGNVSLIAVSQDHCERLSDETITCPHTADRPAGFEDVHLRDIWPMEAWGEPTDWVAAACVLYPCLKFYSGRVENGSFDEKTVRTTPLRPQFPEALWSGVREYLNQQRSWAGVQEPCWVNGTLYTSSNMSSSSEILGSEKTTTIQWHNDDWAEEDLDAPVGYRNVTAPLECVVSMSAGAVYALGVEMFGLDSFGYKCQTAEDGEEDYYECLSSSGRSWHLGALLHGKTTTMHTIRESIDSATRRVTTQMRLSGRGRENTSTTTVEGQAWRTTVCVRVAWGWLALPGTALALTTVVLACVIAKDLMSKDAAFTWKSSVLPFLLKDHPGLEAMSLKEVEEVAKGFEVMVKNPEAGGSPA